MSNVNFRLADSSDAGALARMMTALSEQQQTVEKLEDDPTVRSVAVKDLEGRLAQHSPDQEGHFQALLVEIDDLICGCLVFNITYDAILGRNCVSIRHLYVEESLRRQKLGSHLMVNIARLAKEQGWARIEWLTERLDLETRIFFDRISEDSFRLHKLSYTLDETQIDQILESIS